MKHTIIILAMLIGVSASAQTQRTDSLLITKDQLTFVGIASNGDSLFTLNMNLDKINSLQKAQDSLASIVKSILLAIPAIDLAWSTKPVTTSTYTLQADDDRKILLVSQACTIYVPPLAAGFNCKIVRRSNAAVRFASGGANLNTWQNFTQIAGLNGIAELYYLTGNSVLINLNLTK